MSLSTTFLSQHIKQMRVKFEDTGLDHPLIEDYTEVEILALETYGVYFSHAGCRQPKFIYVPWTAVLFMSFE